MRLAVQHAIGVVERLEVPRFPVPGPGTTNLKWHACSSFGQEVPPSKDCNKLFIELERTIPWINCQAMGAPGFFSSHAAAAGTVQT